MRLEPLIRLLTAPTWASPKSLSIIRRRFAKPWNSGSFPSKLCCRRSNHSICSVMLANRGYGTICHTEKRIGEEACGWPMLAEHGANTSEKHECMNHAKCNYQEIQSIQYYSTSARCFCLPFASFLAAQQLAFIIKFHQGICYLFGWLCHELSIAWEACSFVQPLSSSGRWQRANCDYGGVVNVSFRSQRISWVHVHVKYAYNSCCLFEHGHWKYSHEDTCVRHQ